MGLDNVQALCINVNLCSSEKKDKLQRGVSLRTNTAESRSKIKP